MNNLFNTKTLKNGKHKFSFSKHGIRQYLKNELNFGFSKIGKKSYYLKQNSENIYIVTPFNKLKDDFLSAIKSDKELMKNISFEDFKQDFSKQSPIKNEEYLTNFLSENHSLSADNLHDLSMDLDDKYRTKYNFDKMMNFLKEEDFVIKENKSEKNRLPELFCYKKLNETQYLIFHRDYCDKTYQENKFDLWKYEAREVSWFLRFGNEYPRKTELKLNFDLEKDKAVYNFQS